MKRLIAFVVVIGSVWLILNQSGGNIWISLHTMTIILCMIWLGHEWYKSRSMSFFSLKRGQVYSVLSSHMQRFNDPDDEDKNYIHVFVDGEVRSFYVSMYEVEGGFADSIESGETIKWDYVSGCPFFRKKKVFITNG